jgi:hypothetical protein
MQVFFHTAVVLHIIYTGILPYCGSVKIYLHMNSSYCGSVSFYLHMYSTILQLCFNLGTAVVPEKYGNYAIVVGNMYGGGYKTTVTCPVEYFNIKVCEVVELWSTNILE